ncbi:MAG TPA: thiamine phosphate synthase [Nocardioides sp.]|uniref:thiamine phosphate synthase n=1 Tax=Nocardioides sp. TaxID=35761 RepID=UPI002B6159DC|nr:thiamine phosphate synthase [Nocardioides sp.]HTW16677.1 thiamine phosphate synthase [Nocardioides sp.]
MTDRSQLRLGRSLVRTVRECADAGLEAVVVREHDLEPRSRHALVAALAGVGDLSVISSRIPDEAADGVHLAARQAPAAGWWGRSCHGPDEVRRAAEQGASWVTLSPYAASASKPRRGPALPPDAFAGHPLPVLALAGVEVDNAAAAVGNGAHGVAVMGAVMRSDDPAAVVRALLRELA